MRHVPVMVKEVLAVLKPKSGEKFIDATLGDGGHAEAILERVGRRGRVLGIDRDPDMVRRAKHSLLRFGVRAIIVQGNFQDLAQIAGHANIHHCDGILFDLGVASHHFDEHSRGFSFRYDARLDMRFDPEGMEESAYDIVNFSSFEHLEYILRHFGEEPDAKRIAHAIMRNRPILTTTELTSLVARTKRRSRSLRNPATKTFQAIRVAVNHELDALSVALPQAVTLLRFGGVLSVIAYHSLEDRIVKRFFHEERKNGSLEPLFRNVKRPTDREVRINPRSRSAILRAARRVQIL